MPLTKTKRTEICRRIFDKSHEIREKINQELRAIGIDRPIGAEHMCLLFQAEGLDGFLSALRQRRPIRECIDLANERMSESVKKFNDNHPKEWQIHRDPSTAERSTVSRILSCIFGRTIVL